jgi:hypothetical protein
LPVVGRVFSFFYEENDMQIDYYISRRNILKQQVRKKEEANKVKNKNT